MDRHMNKNPVDIENDARPLCDVLADAIKLKYGCADPGCDVRDGCRIATEIRDAKGELRFALLTKKPGP